MSLAVGLGAGMRMLMHGHVRARRRGPGSWAAPGPEHRRIDADIGTEWSAARLGLVVARAWPLGTDTRIGMGARVDMRTDMGVRMRGPVGGSPFTGGRKGTHAVTSHLC